jgi:diamine N-acetyltransferase
MTVDRNPVDRSTYYASTAMNNIEIRRIKSNEVNQLRSIALKTFLDSFASMNTEENMKEYVDEHLSIDHLTKELNHPDSEFYFALIDEQIIGYLKLNFKQAQSDLKEEKGIEIERIYVLEEFQGKQVGQAFYEHAKQIAQDRSAEYLWLGVWEKNINAIRFYERIGFKKFSSHTFFLGKDRQTDLLMKIAVSH